MAFWEFIWGYIDNYFGISILNTPQGVITMVFGVITALLYLMMAYRVLYAVLGVLGKSRVYKKEYPHDKKYAIVASARNEGDIIANIIDSVWGQNYPKELLTIFICANNCSDNTAEVARSKGAIVYERDAADKKHDRRGYAMKYLFECIDRDYGIDSFDAFIDFSADNVLDPNFVHHMNNAFQDGNEIVLSYRNMKNFEDNFISAAYGINYYRITLLSHRSRSILGCSTNITGSGYLFDKSIVKDGWRFTELNDDTEFSTINVFENHHIAYCEAAEFFDEQPTDFKTSFRQRIRWAKGVFRNFAKHNGMMMKSFFKKPTWSKYDIYFEVFPYPFIFFTLGFLFQIISLILFLCNPSGAYNWVSFWTYVGTSFGGIIVGSYVVGILACIRERKRIHCSIPKLIWYIILWPWFDLISIPVQYISLCQKVTWKQIVHKDNKKASDIVNDEHMDRIKEKELLKKQKKEAKNKAN